MNTYTFLFTSLIMILMPGMGVMYTISTGLTKGKEMSIFAALGCSIGIFPHMLLSIMFSSLIAKMSNEAFFILKLIGALYLLYIGAGMLLKTTSLEIRSQMEDKSSAILFRGFFVNLLNPKLTLFFFSFFPQYVSFSSEDYAVKSLLYGFGFMVLTFIIFIGYGVLAGSAKQLIIGFPKRMSMIQKCFGLIFILFAIQLSLSSI